VLTESIITFPDQILVVRRYATPAPSTLISTLSERLQDKENSSIDAVLCVL